MVYAAHILDPRCKTALITDMMQSKADGIITAVKKYFKTEWPETVAIGNQQLLRHRQNFLKFDLSTYPLHAGKQYKLLIVLLFTRLLLY